MKCAIIPPGRDEHTDSPELVEGSGYISPLRVRRSAGEGG
jgi:hypothetical protein